MDESFDVCGMNWIHNRAWSQICTELLSKSYDDMERTAFIDNFCAWIFEKQKNCDEIMVEGTL